VFALGVLLYEYACGANPFEAPTALAHAARVLESDVRPLDRVRPDVGPSLAAVIERSMRKAPADRFPSAAEMARALARESERPRAASVRRWWRTHQLAIIGLYVIACILGWQIKELRHASSDQIFLFLGFATTVGGVFRGHLVFTEQMNRASLESESRRATPALLIVDLLIAAALAGDGLAIGSTRQLFAVVTLSVSVGIALARLVLEPATTKAAFGRD
jgi:hypothetical protein